MHSTRSVSWNKCAVNELDPRKAQFLSDPGARCVCLGLPPVFFRLCFVAAFVFAARCGPAPRKMRFARRRQPHRLSSKFELSGLVLRRCSIICDRASSYACYDMHCTHALLWSDFVNSAPESAQQFLILDHEIRHVKGLANKQPVNRMQCMVRSKSYVDYGI